MQAQMFKPARGSKRQYERREMMKKGTKGMLTFMVGFALWVLFGGITIHAKPYTLFSPASTPPSPPAGCTSGGRSWHYITQPSDDTNLRKPDCVYVEFGDGGGSGGDARNSQAWGQNIAFCCHAAFSANGWYQDEWTNGTHLGCSDANHTNCFDWSFGRFDGGCCGVITEVWYTDKADDPIATPTITPTPTNTSTPTVTPTSTRTPTFDPNVPTPQGTPIGVYPLCGMPNQPPCGVTFRDTPQPVYFQTPQPIIVTNWPTVIPSPTPLGGVSQYETSVAVASGNGSGITAVGGSDTGVHGELYSPYDTGAGGGTTFIGFHETDFGCPLDASMFSTRTCIKYKYLDQLNLGPIPIPTWPFTAMLCCLILGWIVRR